MTSEQVIEFVNGCMPRRSLPTFPIADCDRLSSVRAFHRSAQGRHLWRRAGETTKTCCGKRSEGEESHGHTRESPISTNLIAARIKPIRTVFALSRVPSAENENEDISLHRCTLVQLVVKSPLQPGQLLKPQILCHASVSLLTLPFDRSTEQWMRTTSL